MSGPTFPHLPGESWERFLREELDDTEATRLERHLADCAACLSILEAEDPAFLFRRLRDAAAPAGTWDGFWEELEPQLPAQPRRSQHARPLLLATAAAVLAAAALAVFGGRWMIGGGDPGSSRADRTTQEDPCPAAVASLRLTREECLALFGAPIEGPQPPEVILSESMDLRGL